MRSEDEKARIRLEELYRHEVRKELWKTRDIKERVWDFLNCSFGLFLASALFLGGVSFLFNEYKEGRSVSQIKADALSRISEELSYRIEFFSSALRDSILVF